MLVLRGLCISCIYAMQQLSDLIRDTTPIMCLWVDLVVLWFSGEACQCLVFSVAIMYQPCSPVMSVGMPAVLLVLVEQSLPSNNVLFSLD